MKLKTIILIILALIIIPILINYLVAYKAPSWINIAGGNQIESTWVGFWASFGGSVLGAIVTVIVLSKTLEQNDKNREEAHRDSVDNSKRQIRQMKYEVSRQNLSVIRNSLVDCYLASIQEKTSRLFLDMKLHDTPVDLEEHRQAMADVVDDLNRAYYRLKILFPDSYSDNETKVSLDNIKMYADESHAYLFDLVAFSWLLYEYDGDLSNLAKVEEEVLRQKKASKVELGVSVWDNIINNSWFDVLYYKTKILDSWNRGRDAVNTSLCNELINLNSRQTDLVERILSDL